jgi:hypothetical protein
MESITSDEDLVNILDDLSFHLKPLNSKLGLAFRSTLHDFIREHKLDGEPHCFATLPPPVPSLPLTTGFSPTEDGKLHISEADAQARSPETAAFSAEQEAISRAGCGR